MNADAILACLPSLAESAAVTPAVFAQRTAHVPATAIRQLVPLAELPEGEWRVRAGLLPAVREDLAKLTKRAERLGVAAPQLEELRTEVVPVVASWRDIWTTTEEVRSYTIVRPTTTPVRFAGWSFVATIQHLGQDGNIIRSVPGFTGQIPVAYRSASYSFCEHCQMARRRNDTYVLQHEDGRFTRVGKNCLADFIGSASAEAVVALAVWRDGVASLLAGAADEDAEGGGYGGGLYEADAVRFLSVVALIISKHGWLSRSAAKFGDREATADAAWRALFPSPKYAEEARKLRAEVTEAHVADAKAALDWALAIPEDTTGDFLYNVRTVAGVPAWTARLTGIGAAILMAYQKEQERLKRMEFERRLPSVHLGAVGERFGGKGKGAKPALTARVLGVHKKDGLYGLTTIIRMQAIAADGGHTHDLVWFASGEVSVCTDRRAVEDSLAADKVDAALLAQLEALPADAPADEREQLVQAERDAYRAAQVRAAEARRAWREIAAGDLVTVVGTVKKHGASTLTKRPETILSRCELGLIAEQVEAK